MRSDPGLARRRAAVSRRTSLIWWAKIILPFAAIVLVSLIFLTGRQRGDVSDLFTPAELATLGAGLKLDRPRFAGALETGEPYEVSADWALPDSAMPNIVDLERPVGRITLAEGREVTARADLGRLQRAYETMTLTGGVVIITSDGYRVETEELALNLGEKSARAPGSVRANGPRGSLEAGSFRMTSREGDPKSAQFWFENRVRVVFLSADP